MGQPKEKEKTNGLVGMQESLLQTADAKASPSDSGCRRLSIRQPLQETIHQTANAGVSLSNRGQGGPTLGKKRKMNDKYGPKKGGRAGQIKDK